MTPRPKQERRHGFPRRQRLAGAVGILLVFLSACGRQVEVGEEGSVRGFIGGAVADEPRAALAARDVLSAGGTAADAAAALYFTLAVTYPGAASLGGGGLCVIYNRKDNKGQVLDFLARAPARAGPIGVPGNVRGMAALQARFGRLHWEQVLAAAEQAARIGVPASRATVRAMAASGPAVPGPLLDGADGAPLKEGDPTRQVALGASLSRLRTAGPGDFYNGQLSQTLLQDIADAGGTVSAEDLRGLRAEWQDPITIEFEHITLMLPGTPGGKIFRELWQSTVAASGLISTSRVDFGKFAASLGPAYQGVDPAAAVNPGASTGFAVVDREANAVACVVSMQRAFGVGKVATATGILLGPPPEAGGENRYMTPVVAANYNVKQLFLAGAAAGGAPAPAAMAETAIWALAGGKRTGEALSEPRLFATAPGGPIWHEPKLDPGLAGRIVQRGLSMREVPDLARVNLDYCINAIPRGEETCSFRADPRGFGMGAGTGY